MPIDDQFAAEIRAHLEAELYRYGLGDVVELALSRELFRDQGVTVKIPASRDRLVGFFGEVIDILNAWSPAELPQQLNRINQLVERKEPLTGVELYGEGEETPFDLSEFTDYRELAAALETILITILEENE